MGPPPSKKIEVLTSPNISRTTVIGFQLKYEMAKKEEKVRRRINWGVAVVEWLRSRPLDCEVRGSNPGQGRNLKTKISASGVPQRW